MHPNLVEHLSAFLLVAETGTFSAAARETNRAVSSVSYSVTQLETYFGFPLFERKSHRAELTDRGRALYTEAKVVVAWARRLTHHASTLSKGQETRIRIAIDLLFPLPAIHSALKEFSNIYNKIFFQMFTTSLNALWEELRSDRMDFAFGLFLDLPDDMEGVFFRKISFSPAISTTHALSKEVSHINISDLANERQIYYVRDNDVELEREWKTYSPMVWTCNDLENIRLLVNNGFGWSFGTHWVFKEEIKRNEVTLLNSDDARLHPVRSIGAAWPVMRPPGPLGHKLIDLIAEFMEDL